MGPDVRSNAKTHGFVGPDVRWIMKTNGFVGPDARWTVITRGFVGPDLRRTVNARGFVGPDRENMWFCGSERWWVGGGEQSLQGQAPQTKCYSDNMAISLWFKIKQYLRGRPVEIHFLHIF